MTASSRLSCTCYVAGIWSEKAKFAREKTLYHATVLRVLCISRLTLKGPGRVAAFYSFAKAQDVRFENRLCCLHNEFCYMLRNFLKWPRVPPRQVIAEA